MRSAERKGLGVSRTGGGMRPVTRNGEIVLRKVFIMITLITLLSASFVFSGAASLVEQSEEFFVNDAAGVLTEVTKRDIISANIDLMEKCQGAQIVIVTVEYLGDMYADEYATRLFNSWGVGSAEYNNGMLLLLATQELRGWLTVGEGITGAFTNSMIESYLDSFFWPEVDARNFDTAVRNICEALFSWYAGYYGVNQGNNAYESAPTYVPQPDYVYYEPVYYPRFNIMWMFFPLLLIFVIVFMFAAVGADRRGYRAYYRHTGMPMPPYHWWYMWGATRPYRTWYRTNHHWYGPRGPRGPGGFGGGPGRPGGSGRPPSSGGFGGFGGSGGGFGGGGGFSGGGGGRR